MAITAINTIKNWFKTGLIPTQEQFWAWMDSYRHKSEKIPVADIEGIDDLIAGKASTAVVNSHIDGSDAHQALFDLKVDKDGTKTLSDQNYTLSEKKKLDYIDQTKDVDKPVSTPQATADATVLTTAQTYSDSVIDQLKGGVSLNYDTLKKLADELTAIRSIVGGTTADADNIINTVAELMAVLSTYPEGTDLFALVQDKVAKADVYNALDCIVSGKVADARQLKVLNDLITTLNSNLVLKEDSANKSNSILDLESTTKFPVWQAIKNWCVSQFKNVLLGIKTVPDLTYSLISTDNTKRLLFTNANPVTATIPTNATTAIPVGSKIEYTQQGNGVVTVGGTGVTVLTNLSLTSVKGETRILTKVDVDSWTLEGNISSSGIDSNNIYVDLLNGSDITGQLGNSSKPYKTLGAALTAANLTTTYRTFNLMSDGIYLFIGSFLAGHYVFKSDRAITISFASNNVFDNISNQYLITNLTIDIPLGNILFQPSQSTYITCNAMNVKIKAVNATFNNFEFTRIYRLDLELDTLINNNSYSLFSVSQGSVSTSNVKINKITSTVAGSLISFSAGYLDIIIKELITSAVFQIIRNSYNSGIVNISIGNITSTYSGSYNLIPYQYGASVKINFMDSVFSGASFFIEGHGSTEMILTGRIKSTTSTTSLIVGFYQGYSGTIYLRNFTANLNNAIYESRFPLLGKFIIENINIKASQFASFYNNESGNRSIPILTILGYNSITSTTNAPLFYFGNAVTNAFIDNYGKLRTNCTNTLSINNYGSEI